MHFYTFTGSSVLPIYWTHLRGPHVSVHCSSVIAEPDNSWVLIFKILGGSSPLSPHRFDTHRTGWETGHRWWKLELPLQLQWSAGFARSWKFMQKSWKIIVKSPNFYKLFAKISNRNVKSVIHCVESPTIADTWQRLTSSRSSVTDSGSRTVTDRLQLSPILCR